MILTFDVGTTAIKTSLFGRDLSLTASRTDEYDLLTDGGRVELCPETYVETMIRAVAALGKDQPLAQVQAICLTTQGETMIPVDKDGTPLHNAVVWLDDRAEAQAGQISAAVDSKELYARTGVTDMNGFVPLAKLLWFRQERPEIYENTYKFLLLEDYLLQRLTGRFVTEKSLLTSTAWYDIRNDGYWKELLEQLELAEEKLPQILDCGSLVGSLTPWAAEAFGLNAQVQVFAGAMDQIAAAIGGGGLQEGVVTATIGTAMVLTAALNTMDECTDDRLIVYRGVQKDQYVLLPLCNTAGAVFKWYKDQVCRDSIAQSKQTGEDVYDVLCREASQVPPGAQGVTMLPYFAGSLQPKLLPQAKGMFFGLDLTTDRKCMTRAVLESVGYMLRENLEMLESFGKRPQKVHFFGGGAKNPVWNQIIADITGTELVLLEQSECGSLGAAMLCSVSLGWYASIADAQKCNPVCQVVKPHPDCAYEEAYRRYCKLFAAVEPMFEYGKENPYA